MSEASGGISRAEMERSIVQRSIEDEDFRQLLLEDPKAAVELELGSQLPEAVEVRLVQESQQSIYLVLPFASTFAEGEELSERDLEAVAGGAYATSGDATCAGDWSATCQTRTH